MLFWFGVMHICSTLIDLLRIGRLSDHEKDLEILLLRQQLALVESKKNETLHVSRIELWGVGVKKSIRVNLKVKQPGDSHDVSPQHRITDYPLVTSPDAVDIP